MNLNVLNNCNHYGMAFRGSGLARIETREPTCAKGIDVRAHVGGDDFGWLRRVPCVNSSFSAGVVACSLAEFPTIEERVANEKQLMAERATIGAGKCPDCGKALVKRETAEVVLTACPDGHVSMHGCKRIGGGELEVE